MPHASPRRNTVHPTQPQQMLTPRSMRGVAPPQSYTQHGSTAHHANGHANGQHAHGHATHGSADAHDAHGSSSHEGGSQTGSPPGAHQHVESRPAVPQLSLTKLEGLGFGSSGGSMTMNKCNSEGGADEGMGCLADMGSASCMTGGRGGVSGKSLVHIAGRQCHKVGWQGSAPRVAFCAGVTTQGL